jgi:hypothetical protein
MTSRAVALMWSDGADLVEYRGTLPRCPADRTPGTITDELKNRTIRGILRRFPQAGDSNVCPDSYTHEAGVHNQRRFYSEGVQRTAGPDHACQRGCADTPRNPTFFCSLWHVARSSNHVIVAWVRHFRSWPKLKCRWPQAMSAIGVKADSLCSLRAFPVLTQSGHRTPND